jgi:hypothetical protein
MSPFGAVRRPPANGAAYDPERTSIRALDPLRGKDSETAARELGAWAQSQGIKVEFELRREGGLDVIYVFLAAR